MATTYEIITGITGQGNPYTVPYGGIASVTFSAIPGTYTDLVVKISARSSATPGSYDPYLIRFNGSNSGYSGRVLHSWFGTPATGTNTTATSAAASGTWGRATGTGTPLADTTTYIFSNSEFYIPNYASANQKSGSVDTALENTSTTAFIEIDAIVWTGTDPITSVAFALKDGSFVEHSTFYLYGIKKD